MSQPASPVLTATFTPSGVNGMTVVFRLDASQIGASYGAFDLNLRVDPAKATLVAASSADFAGQIVIVNNQLIAQGRFQVSATGSIDIPISTGVALGTLRFTNVAQGGFDLIVDRLNVNAAGFITTANRHTYKSDGTVLIEGDASSGQDTTPPEVLSTAPANNGAAGLTQDLTVTFNEAIRPGTSGTIELRTAQGTPIESFNLASTDRVTVSGSTLKVDPVSNLQAGISYRLILPAGAVTDIAGNALRDSFSFNFGAINVGVDQAPPQLTSLLPQPGATGVSTNAPIVVRFNEEVRFGTGAIRLEKANGELVASFSAGSPDASLVGDTLTLRPPLGLSTATDFNLVFANNAIQDTAGNFFAGVSGYSFRTANLQATDLSVQTNRSTVDEGGVAIFTVSAQGLPQGTVLNYQITGDVIAADIQGGQMSGSLTLGPARTAQLAIRPLADRNTEGPERLTLSVEGVQASVTVNDTSTSPLVPQQIRANSKGGAVVLTSASDVVLGGPGLDNAFVNGHSSSYAIRLEGERSFLSQLSSRNIDTLVNVERVQFSDKVVALDINGVPGDVYRLYKGAFNRTPDWEGIGYWIHRMEQGGASLVQVAREFTFSPEFNRLYPANQTETAFVSQVYQNMLGRPPDIVGLNFYEASLILGRKTRPQVLADISYSPENRTVVAELIANGIDYLPWIFG